MKNIISKKRKENGQMMILMTIIISATVLTAIAFSTFVIVSELRNITDARASAEALFAADTGMECILFREFGNVNYGEGCPTIIGDASLETELFSGGPKFSFKHIRSVISGQTETIFWEATGKDRLNRAIRSLEITLQRRI